MSRRPFADRRRRSSSASLRNIAGTPESLLEALEQRVLLSHGGGMHPLDAVMPLHTVRVAPEPGTVSSISTSVAAIGDVDGDGVADFVVGVAAKNSSGRGGDAVRSVAAVYSGATGQQLFRLSDGFDHFGASVAGVGDINGDGVPDIAVGSPLWGTDGDDDDRSGRRGGDDDDNDDRRGVGRVYIYSGATGSLLLTLTGDQERARFGAAVVGLGDIDDDGVPDIAVGAPLRDASDNRRDAGAVFLFSGADGALIQRIDGQVARGQFGFSLAATADLDDDDVPDLVVGAPGSRSGGFDLPGSAFVISGDGGQVIFTFTGEHRRDLFGYSVASGGDVDGDGVMDIVIGAPNHHRTVDEARAAGAPGGAVPGAGRFAVYSGADGSEIGTVIGDRPNGNLGAAVAIAGDFNDDGFDDVIVGQPFAGRNALILIFSGDDGQILAHFLARNTALVHSDGFGTSIAVLGDIDDDGVNDFVFGATHSTNFLKGDRARAYVLSGASATPGAPPEPGRPTPGGPIDVTLPDRGRYEVATLNDFGDIIVHRRDPATNQWESINLTEVAGAPRATDVGVFTFERTGTVYFVAVTPDGVYLIHERFSTPARGQRPVSLGWDIRNLTEELAGQGATPITHGLTIMMDGGPSGWPVIAGVDAAGDVVVYRAGAVDAQQRLVFRFSNLSEEHLRPNQFITPEFSGTLISFVTPWNALNIVGLDENGQMWAVWTAPELNGQWQSVNLSELTGAPALTGGLTPFLTPWGAINIAGNDAAGETVVTWWIPTFGPHWAKNNLTAEFGFPVLQAESVSSFVTPWGALNIAGLDDAGELTVYWWVPGDDDQWKLARLEVERPDDLPEDHRGLTGMVRGFAGRDMAMNLFSITPEGELVRVHWSPGQSWTMESVTTG